MLSGLRNKEQKSSVPESNKSTDIHSESVGNSWKETSDDIVTAGSKKFMSHQERYEFVKNRSYSPVKPSQTRN